MNTNEAQKILELSNNPSDEDIKKAFRKLAAKYHPDRNKESDAENKFKKINEAYQFLTNPQPQGFSPQDGNPFSGINFEDIFGGNHGFGSFQQKQRHAEPIQIALKISFEESILGTKKNIKFSRETKCNSCNGLGKIKINNGCKKCGGSGRITTQRGNVIMQQSCDQCRGSSQTKDCQDCQTDGIINVDTELSVNIPGGVSTGNALRLNNMGNYAGNFGPMDQYTDAFIVLEVTPHNHLSLENGKVICNISISLLEALQGTTKFVPTVLGDKQINIPRLAKNKDEIIIPKVGVNQTGDQNVIINIDYPKNIDNLITTLQKDV